jgi:hypothetical protein
MSKQTAPERPFLCDLTTLGEASFFLGKLSKTWKKDEAPYYFSALVSVAQRNTRAQSSHGRRPRLHGMVRDAGAGTGSRPSVPGPSQCPQRDSRVRAALLGWRRAADAQVRS